MNLGLKGKNAAITGATRGIGRAIADLLVSEGCNVSICARNADSVNQVVGELSASGAKAIGSSVDVSDSTAQSAWIDASAKDLGGLDIFIANVSAMNLGDDEESWKQSFDLDMLATFTGSQAAIPHLKRSDAGAMVLVSSIAALHTPAGPKAYGAMKAGVLHYAKGLARSLAPEGIRVNSVSPGNIYFEDGIWGRVEKNNPEGFKAQMAANPMGRMGRPDEVASAAVYLASPAASFISGTNLLVDGALTLGVQY